MPNTFLGPLHVQREVHNLSIVVRAAGEVDEFTVLPLRMELQTALAMATPPHPVVVDLSAVRFFGSAGLNELLRHHRDAEAAGIPFRIVAAHKVVLRPIKMTGLDDVLRIHPDVEQALAAGQGVRTSC
ncbi:STAS domain-containing protein [Lentzea sp. NPDC058436]|uniref:STAS domain-containing protein n=1 Tax=Lentzea sp. NPDC058436 TaxID=3346499 RepID=UPI0036640586